MTNVQYITYGENMGGVPANTVIETQTQPGGANRQVIAIGDMTPSPRVQTPPNGNVLQVQGGVMDVIAGLPVMIDYNQHQIHEGETYYAQFVSLNTTLTPLKFGITVQPYANTIQAPHMIVEASIYNNAARIDVYEGATFTGGTPITSYNRNRNSATNAATIVTSGVTSTNGTLVFSFFAGSGAKAAGSASSGSEWVLKSNTIYRVDITALVNPTDIIASFNWYEDLGV